MSRTSKYAPELVEQIIRLVESGVFYIDACYAVGIHKDTFYEWLRSKPDFSDSIKKARARAISIRVARIDRAGREGDWKADAWWLERVARDRFGRNPPPAATRTHIVLGFEPRSAFIRTGDAKRRGK